MNATNDRNRVRLGRLGSYRKMAPTSKHRVIAFAGILGTLYAVAPYLNLGPMSDDAG